MHRLNILLSLIVSSSLLPIAFAAPPHIPNNRIGCDYDANVHLTPSHCTNLLRRFSTVFWIHMPISYGMNRPSPGHIPTDITADSCHLELRAKRYTQPAQSEKFRLVDYYEALMTIDQTCFVNGYNGGTADIGKEGKFYAYLGGMWTATSERNGTVVRATNGTHPLVEVATS